MRTRREAQLVDPEAGSLGGNRAWSAGVRADGGRSAARARGLTALGGWLFRHRGPASGVVLLLVVAATRHFALAPIGGRIGGRAADVAGVSIALLAVLLRAAIVATSPDGTSGRNRTRQIAATLNTTGPYSIVRHPLYVANLLGWAGVGLLSGSWLIGAATVVAGIALYAPIIRMEDEFLARTFGPAHRDWAAVTRAVLPRLAAWRPPTHRVSWRTLFRREYPSVINVSVSVCLVHAARTASWSVAMPSPRGWAPALGLVLAGVGGARLVQRRRTASGTRDRRGDGGSPA